MPTLREIRDRADAILTLIWREIQVRQEIFFAARGRYWQGIRTHIVTPTDGVETAPDLTTHPTDQVETWIDVGISFPDIPFALQINVYEGLLGHGYEGVVEVEVEGKLYQRVAQHGPEIWRAHDWLDATPMPD